MGAIGKIIIGIASLIFGIMLIVIVLPAQIQSQQATNSLIQQDTSLLNADDLNLLNVCETDQSVGDLTMCKSGITDIKNKCQNSQYSSMSVCSDPRIDQFLSTVDSKISYAQNIISTSSSNLNNAMLTMINTCSLVNDTNNLSTCKTEMTQIQENCISLGVNAVPECNDPRMVQIMNEQVVEPTNQNNATSQTMESFINECMATQNSNTIQDCATNAKNMINLCQTTPGITACSDPRLEQIANMGQSTNPTYPLNTPSQTPINATALDKINSQFQIILNDCINSAISNSTTCINSINIVKQDCGSWLEKTYPSYFPVCSDPRLQ